MVGVILALIFGYLGVSVLLGLFARRRAVAGAEDYFLASRSVSWFHLGLTIFATWFSTFAFLGLPGFYYSRGVGWYLTTVIYLLSAPLMAWFIGRKIWLLGRERGYITPADLLADYYRIKGVRLLVALVSILALVPYCLIQFVGVGKVIAAATGGALPYSLGIILVASVTAFYSIFGGVRAIVWTDILQGVLFLSVILFGAAIAYLYAGGLVEGYAKSVAVRPDIFVLDPVDSGPIFTLAFIWTLGFVVLPHLWQRAYMARSAQAFSGGIVMFSLLSAVLIIGTMLMGTLGIPLISGLEDPDKFVPALYQQYATFALPLLVLATFAAGMSTIDSQLLSASSVLVHDICKPLMGKSLTSRREERLGKLFVFLLITFLATLALLPGSQGSIILLASKGTAIAVLLFIPLVGAVSGFRISGGVMLSSLIVGAAVLAGFEMGLIIEPFPLKLGAIVYAVGAQLLVVAGSRLCSRG